MMETSKYWNNYKGKQVKLIITDIPHPKAKDGILVDYDSTHVFLEITNKSFKNYSKVIPFSRHSIKRLELQE